MYIFYVKIQHFSYKKEKKSPQKKMFSVML